MGAYGAWMLLLTLLACTVDEEPEGDSAPCQRADDTGAEDSGPGDAEQVDPLDALGACAPGEPGDRLDIDGGCFDGVCLGQTLAQADAAFGSPGFCLAFGTSALCFWGDGILGSATDTDGDGNPDEGARLWAVQAIDPWDGADAAGLSLGLGFGCFVDGLGTPDSLTFTLVAGELVATAATWTSLDFSVTDQQDLEYAFVPDGRVEALVFQNAIYQ